MFGPREELTFASTASAGVTFGRAGVPRRAVPASNLPATVLPASDLPASEPPFSRPEQDWRLSSHPLARRGHAICSAVERQFTRHPLVSDLAEDIGSAEWLRGVFTLVVLIVLALAARPAFELPHARSGAWLDEAQQSEWRSLAIKPWQRGAGQGRHFAAGEAVVRLDNVPERPIIELTATLGEDDSLTRMLQRAGVASGDAGQVAALIDRAVPADTIAPGMRFDLTLGHRASPADPRPLQALRFRPRFDLALVIGRTGGGTLALERHPIAVDTAPLRLSGIVGQSLYRTARGAGAPPDTVQTFLQTIDSHLPFEAIDPGDTFDLVVDYKRAADGQGAVGNLLYAGIVRQGHPLVQLLRWGNDGAYATLDDLRGDAAGEGGALLSPVAGAITSGFGMRRHPILGFVRLHAGVDFASSYGAPVYAVAEGAVTFAGWHGGHGNYVRIDHGGGIGTGYGHMSRLAVAPGMAVRRGQVIGYVGSTGLSTGPHLHYEVYRGGQPIDPLSLRSLAPRHQVDPVQLAAFRTRLAQLTALPQGILPRR